MESMTLNTHGTFNNGGNYNSNIEMYNNEYNMKLRRNSGMFMMTSLLDLF